MIVIQMLLSRIQIMLKNTCKYIYFFDHDDAWKVIELIMIQNEFFFLVVDVE